MQLAAMRCGGAAVDGVSDQAVGERITGVATGHHAVRDGFVEEIEKAGPPRLGGFLEHIQVDPLAGDRCNLECAATVARKSFDAAAKHGADAVRDDIGGCGEMPLRRLLARISEHARQLAKEEWVPAGLSLKPLDNIRRRFESGEHPKEAHRIEVSQSSDGELSRFAAANKVGQVSAQRMVGRQFAVAVGADDHKPGIWKLIGYEL